MRGCILALLLSVLPIGAGAAEISDQYSLGTSNTAIFSGVAEKLPFGTHYVYWREDQYTYALAYSDTLEVDGSTFTGEDVTIVRYETPSGYQTAATFWESTVSSFDLDTMNLLVYSDLGSYPDLIKRGEVTYEALACFMLGSFAVWYLFGRLVRACKRC